MIRTALLIMFFWLSTMWLLFESVSAVQVLPDINCWWLPGCGTKDAPSSVDIEGVWAWIVALIIQYTAVLAVIALMLSGIMYMVSGWVEEKTKKAKTWILWSIVAVLTSMSAWFIITSLNNISINLQ